MVLWVDIGMSMYNGCASGHCRVLSTSRPDLVVSFLVLQHNARKLVLLITIMDGWMTCDFTYVLFNSISVISGRCLDDTERLCAMELRLRLRRFHSSEDRTRSARSVGQRLTH